MTAKFFAILTNQGAALLANAAALGTKLNLTQMAVGDGNGTLPTPDAAQTKLVNQKRIAPLNMLSVDPNNASQIIAEQIIPENEGGFWIREIGIYDDNGVLIAVANCPETYKPQLQEGSGRTQTIRMVLIVSSTAAVTLKIDPSVVLATRQYVESNTTEVKAYADDLLKQHNAAGNPHPQYAPLASPVFTGTPKAPTAAQTSNDTQIATTAFVKEAVSFKQQSDKTLTDISGKDVPALLQYLGLVDSSGFGGRLAGGRKVITVSGTYIPTPGCKLAFCELVGGGGGGGGCYLADSSGASAGGGGGSGGYSFFIFLNPVPTAVTIGSGGGMGVIAANATPANGTAGGDTTFGSLAKAKGGYGGLSAGWAVPVGTSDMACTDGGGGGVTGKGDYAICGNWGGRGLQLARNGSAGYGAPSKLGSGGHRTIGTSGEIIYPTFGGGGLGNYRASGNSFTGTDGANGVCIVWEYF